MAATVVGIDIGAKRIRGVEVRAASKSSPMVVRVHQVALPEGTMRAGEIAEPGTVTEALRHLWREARFGTKLVALAAAGSKVYARDVALPLAPIAQLRESLPFTVQDLIPMPVTQATLDFYPAAEAIAEEGPVIRGILVAAAKDTTTTLTAAVLRAKLTPVAVDIIPFALARAIEPVGTGSGTTAIVEIGSSVTNIAILDRGVPQFVRMIPIGGDDVTSGITRRLQISPAHAEQLKLRVGVAVNAVSADQRPAAEGVYAGAWDLISAVRDTLNYFTTGHEGRRIDRVVLLGDGTRIAGLDALIGELTRIPVSRPDAAKIMPVAKSAVEALRGTTDEFLAAYGLALGAA